MNYIFSIGPSLYFNPNLLHINTIWEQVQVQIQALGLSNKCVLANLWYESNKQLPENFPSLNQSVLAAISDFNYERQRNQSKDLARGAQISQEGFAGMLIISGCLWLSGQESRTAASYHQLTKWGRIEWVNPVVSLFSIMAQHIILLITKASKKRKS